MVSVYGITQQIVFAGLPASAARSETLAGAYVQAAGLRWAYHLNYFTKVTSSDPEDPISLFLFCQ